MLNFSSPVCSKPLFTVTPRLILSALRTVFITLVVGWVACLSQMAQAASLDDLWLYVKNDQANNVSELFVQQKLDPNAVNVIGTPLLMQAVRDGSWKVYDLVLSQPNVDINKTNGYLETPMMYLSIVGDLPRIQQLRTKGAELNTYGWTALHYASVKGHTEVVKYLLQEGAMPNAPSPNGTTALMMAMANNHQPIVQLLLNAGADPYLVDANGNTALSEALDRGNTDLADALKQWMTKHPQKAQ